MRIIKIRRRGAALARLSPVVPTLMLLIGAPGLLQAQTVPGAPAAAQVAPISAGELEQIVGPIALYPDDLLAILLPASTFPLDVVKAQRFLEKRKSDSSLKPDPNLPEPIHNLLNYPDVVKSMSDDLDWTERLGEAVKSQQREVMEAIQVFRRKTHAAGNLKTDDKQIVVVEKEVVKVVPADPQIIYVPQYQPSVVVVTQPAPVVAYYPTPYPVYYYPYPPGATFATGFFMGAATAYAFNWGGSSIYHGVNAYELQEERYEYASNLQEDRQGYATGAREDRQQAAKDRQTQRQESTGGAQGPSQQTASQMQEGRANRQGERQTWSSQSQPAQAQQHTARPGDASTSVAGQSGGRPSPGSLERGGGDAFSGVGSGSSAQQASQRGAQSRGSFGGGQASARGGFGGGGGRSGGGRRR